ncbi:MAG: polyprenyl synthetase family protein [Betaproteobacteria bacterium]|nr:polyprenyl synthetase family protein [Betaproteobacteria bacterium]NBY04666.1 polyprenyl synthetase family protein [Betaproteobacteria bacterium]
MNSSDGAFRDWSARCLEQLEAALSEWVPLSAPAGLGQAMRYAVLDGGKRLRPLLCLAAARALSGAPTSSAALRSACAVELIHAYSLVHDDMPCMDNDVLRRGKPTVHVAFGEAQALLAGDALQALAFELLTPEDGSVALPVQALLCQALARAAGHQGMAGGQAIDLAHVGLAMGEAALRDMHKRKTGAMLEVSVHMGALSAGADSHTLVLLQRYAQAIGLAFQVVDDILDVTADSATLGKTAGKDQANDKPTFVSLLGLDGAKAQTQVLWQEALQALDQAQLRDDGALRVLAQRVVQRDH